MNRSDLELAITEGIPFVIKMADGNQYEVTDRYSVALGKSTVVVIDSKGLPHVLPMLTITGVCYLETKK